MRDRQKGFTLIELLVVIAIISVLISILMPSLRKATLLARFSMCASNQRTFLAAAMQMYGADNNGCLAVSINGHYPNSSSTNGPGTPSETYQAGLPYYNAPLFISYTKGYPNALNGGGLGKIFYSYVQDVSIFYCPLSPMPLGNGNMTSQYVYQTGDKGSQNDWRSNYFMMWNWMCTEEDSSIKRFFVGPRALEDCSASALASSDEIFALGSGTMSSAHPFQMATQYSSVTDGCWRQAAYSIQPFGAKYNAGYGDGHVESFMGDDTKGHNFGTPRSDYTATGASTIYLPHQH